MKYALIVLASSSLLLGCKKEPVNGDSGDVIPCMCPQENIGTVMANQVPCYGFLEMTNHIEITGEKPFSNVDVNAHFTTKAALQVGGDNTTTVDSVRLNHQSLPSAKDAFGEHMYYSKGNYGTWPSQQQWSVYGANGIPTFTFTADVKNPSADFSKVPDILNKNAVESFRLDDVANITGGNAYISSAGSVNHVSVIVRKGSNKICFPSDQLQQLKAGKATILIILENTEVRSFDRKNIGFTKKIQYSKEIHLVE